jgi:altered-inheritance-of-mitochondria protein 13
VHRCSFAHQQLTHFSQFSQQVVNQLSDRLASSETTPERQTTLDARIRSRIQTDLQHLREEEEYVRHEIELALEKENLNREKTLAEETSGSEGGSLKNSSSLLGDLEEIQRRVEKFHSRRELNEFSTVTTDREALIVCYK